MNNKLAFWFFASLATFFMVNAVVEHNFKHDTLEAIYSLVWGIPFVIIMGRVIEMKKGEKP